MKAFRNSDKFEDKEINKYTNDNEYKAMHLYKCSSNFFDSFSIKLREGNLDEFQFC